MIESGKAMLCPVALVDLGPGSFCIPTGILKNERKIIKENFFSYMRINDDYKKHEQPV